MRHLWRLLRILRAYLKPVRELATAFTALASLTKAVMELFHMFR